MVVFWLRQIFQRGIAQQPDCRFAHVRGVSASPRARLFNGTNIFCKAFESLALRSNREFWSYLSPFSRNFCNLHGRMDGKRRSRRFRISNLRQRGRSIAQDMAVQIFALPALPNISPSRRPIGTVNEPWSSANPIDAGPALGCCSWGSPFHVLGFQSWWGDNDTIGFVFSQGNW